MFGLAGGGIYIAVVHAAPPHLASGERATYLSDFARLCSGGGGYGAAAAYGGQGPHPLVVNQDSSGNPGEYSGPDYTMGGASESSPNAVQLVACSHLIGHASPKALLTCPYSDGYTQTTYQGRWRVDVYRARTGTKVASRILSGGQTPGICEKLVTIAPGERQRVEATNPDDNTYREALSSLVNGA